MIRRTSLVLIIAAGALVGLPQQANAADCKLYDDNGQCVIEVVDPGDEGSKDLGDDGDSKDSGVCKVKWNGVNIPCSIPGVGFFGDYEGVGCYLSPSEATPTDDVQPGPNYKPYVCRQVTSAEEMNPAIDIWGFIIWWPGDEPTITPEQAARAVAATMNFEAIHLGISQKMSGPAGVGYVGVPVWLWAKNAGPITVGPQHKSQTYQGLDVTIDATMTKVVWDLGDGKTVACGAGTAYSTSYGVSESPTCGHNYQHISRSQPGGQYTISATSYWSLAWTAGGQSGTIPLDFTRSTTLQVGEIQVVVTAGG